MPREVEPSLNEKQFFAKALNEGIRIDGRAFDEFRTLEVEFGDEFGVCDVRLGKTSNSPLPRPTLRRPLPNHHRALPHGIPPFRSQPALRNRNTIVAAARENITTFRRVRHRVPMSTSRTIRLVITRRRTHPIARWESGGLCVYKRVSGITAFQEAGYEYGGREGYGLYAEGEGTGAVEFIALPVLCYV
ncbi:putative Exosome complex component rrp45 [Glarea lozoyensis 74030]|uniref:Putative Exosome complex component rrp45 n=1 Tax=Glarea lozoyensis (strain ATCC 74030 / MF5533) TaxID=1104152 RepID=H0EWZ4_GLAL7|nr:putative Exosome complex component rrp45 [Glarea lozoyensis 74030]